MFNLIAVCNVEAIKPYSCFRVDMIKIYNILSFYRIHIKKHAQIACFLMKIPSRTFYVRLGTVWWGVQGSNLSKIRKIALKFGVLGIYPQIPPRTKAEYICFKGLAVSEFLV